MNGSMGCFVPKKALSHAVHDVDDLTGDVRIVHAYGPFAKHFMKTIWNRAFRSHSPNAFGGIRHRRREGAIATQLNFSHRCDRLKRPHILRCWDVVNAFDSALQEDIKGYVESRFEVISRIWSYNIVLSMSVLLRPLTIACLFKEDRVHHKAALSPLTSSTTSMIPH